MNRRKFLEESARKAGAAAISAVAARSASAGARVSLRESPETELSLKVAKGPLRLLDSNPRYFTDGSGKAIFLAGSHTWWNFQDNGHQLTGADGQDPPPVFDFNAYLDTLVAHHHNFIRLWRWEAPKWGDDQPSGAIKYCQPHPWVRSGPGRGSDGKLKFDLTQYNPEYFHRMRARIIAARGRGIYVSIMLFEGWELQYTNAWNFHPFNILNNLNGIDAEPNSGAQLLTEETHRPASAGKNSEGVRTAHNGRANNIGKGLSYNTLSDTPMGKRVLALQEAYLRKVVDSVNDLDNVLFEACNEAGPYSSEWQYHVINYVKEYESGKAKQHPVGMTFQWRGGTNEDLYRSPADWISPNAGNTEESYFADPSSEYRGKIIVDDTDHLCGHTCGDSLWVWKCFCHGLNVLMMEDLSPSPTWQDSARDAMGQARQFSERINLAQMVPVDKIVETGYCLADAGREYLVFQPGNKGEFVLNLSEGPGSYSVEWLNATTGATVKGTPIPGGGLRTFPTPFGGPAVLYLKILK